LLPEHESHRVYQERLRESILQILDRNPDLRTDVWEYTEVISLCYAMDLDRAAPILRRTYARGGPLAIDPVVMLRALLVMLYLHIASFGELVSRLAGSTLLRAIVGCEHPPGRTTFYDFIARLPGFRAMARKDAKRRLRKKRKPRKKYPKGQKAPPRRPHIMQFLEHLRHADLIPQAEELVKTLNLLLDHAFVSISIERGLIGGPQGLVAAGDSSSFVLHSSPYGRRTPECDCPLGTGDLHCPHLRVYAAPAADWNWESSEGRWVYGYRFYELTSASGAELPLCIGLPSRPMQHDSITGYVVLHQYHQLIGRPLAAGILDSAHDNEPTYRLLREMSAVPFIDLNLGGIADKATPIKKTEHLGLCGIDANGTPHCPMGAMLRRGHTRGYQRFVCPLRPNGLNCPHAASCPKRSVHLKPAMSPRYICEVPRGSLAWDKQYDRRTTVERSHNRKKNDFGLEARRNRSRPVVFTLYLLAACLQHVVEWAKRVNGKALLASWLPQAA
jgi:hypothetical protein